MSLSKCGPFMDSLRDPHPPKRQAVDHQALARASNKMLALPAVLQINIASYLGRIDAAHLARSAKLLRGIYLVGNGGAASEIIAKVDGNLEMLRIRAQAVYARLQIVGPTIRFLHLNM